MPDFTLHLRWVVTASVTIKATNRRQAIREAYALGSDPDTYPHGSPEYGSLRVGVTDGPALSEEEMAEDGNFDPDKLFENVPGGPGEGSARL